MFNLGTVILFVVICFIALIVIVVMGELGRNGYEHDDIG